MLDLQLADLAVEGLDVDGFLALRRPGLNPSAISPLARNQRFGSQSAGTKQLSRTNIALDFKWIASNRN